MNKSQKEQINRWGNFDKLNDFTKCFQILSRGGLNLTVEMTGRLVVLYWLYFKTIKNNKMILDGTSAMTIRFKTKKSALKKFNSLKKSIISAEKQWEMAKSLKMVGDTTKYETNKI